MCERETGELHALGSRLLMWKGESHMSVRRRVGVLERASLAEVFQDGDNLQCEPS